MTINTLQIANRLKDAEREGRVAEEIALILQEVWEMQLGQLVTKEYLHTELDRLRMEIEARFEHLRAEIDARFTDVQTGLEAKIAELRAEIDAKFGSLRAEIDARFAATDRKIEAVRVDLEGQIKALRADMEKMELRLTNSLTARMGAMIAAAIAILGGINIFF